MIARLGLIDDDARARRELCAKRQKTLNFLATAYLCGQSPEEAFSFVLCWCRRRNRRRRVYWQRRVVALPTVSNED